MNNLTPENRRNEYKKIVDSLPQVKTCDKMEYIANLIYCSETTAMIWYSKDTPRPIPIQKLRLLKDKLEDPGHKSYLDSLQIG